MACIHVDLLRGQQIFAANLSSMIDLLRVVVTISLDVAVAIHSNSLVELEGARLCTARVVTTLRVSQIQLDRKSLHFGMRPPYIPSTRLHVTAPISGDADAKRDATNGLVGKVPLKIAGPPPSIPLSLSAQSQPKPATDVSLKPGAGPDRGLPPNPVTLPAYILCNAPSAAASAVSVPISVLSLRTADLPQRLSKFLFLLARSASPVSAAARRLRRDLPPPFPATDLLAHGAVIHLPVRTTRVMPSPNGPAFVNASTRGFMMWSILTAGADTLVRARPSAIQASGSTTPLLNRGSDVMRHAGLRRR
ncbi:hypothetical protein GGX14DRAFT_586823 [Mycena pura]|uniref:Uncharacterized protein n=1 Tax=Mycena pura TaxID=153505 RepID=A0AAD6UV21_9AGAR|nr:hypothetical protein GGX14DRAFT_586823 [Mycena pura]